MTDVLTALFADDSDVLVSFIESLRVVYRYALRAGDAIQLACAIIAVPNKQLAFVTLDGDLRDAARAQGFAVLP